MKYPITPEVKERAMRKLMRHRWTIGAAALVLVFALGAISWAATGDAAAVDPDSETVPVPAPGLGMFGPDGLVPDGDLAGFGRMGHRGPLGGGALTDEMKAQIEERRAQMEARRDAFNQLMREKMSTEDQAAFDALLATAQTQRDELVKAQEALRGTTSDIRDLVGKYFPLGDPADGSTDDATGTSGTTSSGI